MVSIKTGGGNGCRTKYRDTLDDSSQRIHIEALLEQYQEYFKRSFFLVMNAQDDVAARYILYIAG